MSRGSRRYRHPQQHPLRGAPNQGRLKDTVTEKTVAEALVAIDGRLKNIEERLGGVETQTKITNGRLSELETREKIVAAVAKERARLLREEHFEEREQTEEQLVISNSRLERHAVMIAAAISGSCALLVCLITLATTGQL